MAKRKNQRGSDIFSTPTQPSGVPDGEIIHASSKEATPTNPSSSQGEEEDLEKLPSSPKPKDRKPKDPVRHSTVSSEEAKAALRRRG